jgi:ABC-2 type transport system ATP-binding protein
MAVIETNGLTKYYGKNRGIIDVGITVNEGEVYGFIGPNGAGKSTMIKTLLNFLFPTSGSAKIFGLDCVSESHVIKKDVGYVPCEINYYEDLTVKQMLDFSDSFHKESDNVYTATLSEKFGLEPKKKTGELSSGNKKKTALVAALSSRPKLLILDEPTNGLDPLMRQTLFESLHEAQRGGATVFLSSHNLDEVQTLCSRVAIIREGRIVDVKELRELAARSAKKVTIKGARLTESIAGGEIISRGSGSIVFSYGSGDVKKLLAELSQMELTDLLIEDVKLSDVFMSYYRDGGEEK